MTAPTGSLGKAELQSFRWPRNVSWAVLLVAGCTFRKVFKHTKSILRAHQTRGCRKHWALTVLNQPFFGPFGLAQGPDLEPGNSLLTHHKRGVVVVCLGRTPVGHFIFNERYRRPSTGCGTCDSDCRGSFGDRSVWFLDDIHFCGAFFFFYVGI